MENNKDTNLFWVDTETTGLDVEKDVLVEIACLITDKDLNIVAEGPDLIIHQNEETLDKMLGTVRDMHAKSGLLEQIRKSKITVEEAGEQVLGFLKEYCSFKASPYCGNTVGFDKYMIKNQMPRVYGYLHYRTIDVSTLKELCKRWYPNLPVFDKKDSKHRARDDIRESVEELKYYRSRIFC